MYSMILRVGTNLRSSRVRCAKSSRIFDDIFVVFSLGLVSDRQKACEGSAVHLCVSTTTVGFSKWKRMRADHTRTQQTKLFSDVPRPTIKLTKHYVEIYHLFF